MIITRTFAAAALAAAAVLAGCGAPGNAPAADTVVATAQTAPAPDTTPTTAAAPTTATTTAPSAPTTATDPGDWEQFTLVDEWDDSLTVGWMLHEASWPAPEVRVEVACRGGEPALAMWAEHVVLVGSHLAVEYQPGAGPVFEAAFESEAVGRTDLSYKLTPDREADGLAMLRRMAAHPGRLLVKVTDDTDAFGAASQEWRWDDTSGLDAVIADLSSECGYSIEPAPDPGGPLSGLDVEPEDGGYEIGRGRWRKAVDETLGWSKDTGTLDGDCKAAYYAAVQVVCGGPADGCERDHLVAWNEALQSGLAGADRGTQLDFYNDTANLFILPAGENRDKSDQDPAEWRPAAGHWCAYAQDWISVKTIWGLSIDQDEQTALAEMLAAC